MLIKIALTLETMQQLITKPWRRSQGLCCRKKIQKHEEFSGPWVLKDLNKEKKVKKFLKNCTFCQKNAKIRDGKILKPLHYH